MTINKVLIIRFSSFGDIVQCSSVVELIRQRSPQAKIDWVTRSEFDYLVKLNHNVDHVWSLNKKLGFSGLWDLGLKLRAKKYDHVYDAHNNLRSKLLSLIIRSRIFSRPDWLTRSKDRLKRILLFTFRINTFPQPFKGIHSYQEPLKKWGISESKNEKLVTWDFSSAAREKVLPFLNTKKELLIQLNRKLLELDSKLCASEEFHKEIKKTTDKIGTLCDEKYLLQADLNILTLNNSLNNKISDKVLEAIQFLNNIQVQKEFINLENFKKAFVNRYETKELPLSMVLDPETGIGYLQNQDMNDTHDILDSFSFKMKEAAQKLQDWSEIDFVLQKKLLECYLHKKNEIIVTERDFNSLYTSLKNTPVTFSVIIETFKNDQIALVTAGNVSAAKILGRFCNGNPEIYNLTKQIIQKENEYHDDKILAEIVHIPESRTGNILKRPPLRKHEISYLCKSGVLKESNLELEDLYVSVKSNRIVLRSKKYNREILPCMSNAHNFTNNSLPIYHFLCELEIQDTKPIFSFNWGVLDLHYNYFPRVIYKGIILCKAKWKIKKEEIASFYKLDQNVMKDLFFKWRSQRNIPRFVNWLNYDNTLLFDLESSIAIELFLKSIKQKEEFFLEEFLFTEKSIVKNNTGDDFSNQIILSYYKEKI